MSEGGAFARAEAALRNGLGFEERLEFFVGGDGGAGFVVAEELPLGDVVQLQLRFQLTEEGQSRALK